MPGGCKGPLPMSPLLLASPLLTLFSEPNPAPLWLLSTTAILLLLGTTLPLPTKPEFDLSGAPKPAPKAMEPVSEGPMLLLTANPLLPATALLLLLSKALTAEVPTEPRLPTGLAPSPRAETPAGLDPGVPSPAPLLNQN